MTTETEESPPPVSPERTRAHEYRINVLATLKATAVLSVPFVFVIMAVFGVGEAARDWAERGILNNEIGDGLSPLVWAAIAAIFAVAVYSSIVKWIWDVWDKREKYATDGPSPEGSDDPASE